MTRNSVAGDTAEPPGVPMPLIEALLRGARARLNSGGGEAVDADLLLAHALGRGRSWLYAHAGDDIDDATWQAFATLVQRRVAGEPVSYLLGTRGLWGFDLAVTAEMLIPRPETVLLGELALQRISEKSQADTDNIGKRRGAEERGVGRKGVGKGKSGWVRVDIK